MAKNAQLIATLHDLAGQIATTAAPLIDWSNFNDPAGEVCQMATDIQAIVREEADVTFAVALASAIISVAEGHNRAPYTPPDSPWVKIERIAFEMLDEVTKAGVEIEVWAPLPHPLAAAAVAAFGQAV